MYAAIPTPAPLVKYIADALVGKEYDQAWVVTQDPGLIEAAGTDAIQVETLDELNGALDQHLNTVPRCTRIRKERAWFHISSGDATMYDLCKRLINIECPQYDCTKGTIYYLGAARMPMMVDKDVNEVDLCTMAIQSPVGVFIDRTIVAKMPSTWIPPKNLGRHKRIHVIDDKFLLGETWNGYHFVYSPGRVKRIITIRARSNPKNVDAYPWMKHTAYQSLLNIIREYRVACQIKPLEWLYGYGRYSANGLDACMRVIVRYHQLAQALGKLQAIEKKITPYVRRLAYHRAVLEQRELQQAKPGNFTTKWLPKQLKRVGGMPKDATARYRAGRAKTRLERADALADKLLKQTSGAKKEQE